VLDCLAEEMWADILTNPLQGMAFRIMQAVLMNCPVNYEKDVNAQQTTTKDNSMDKPVSRKKMVTWKKDHPIFSHTSQECVRQNRSNLLGLTTDRRPRPRSTTDS
jgi:hypothetical protein